MSTSLDEEESTLEAHLAHGINGVLANTDEKQPGSGSLSEDERKMPAAVSQISISDNCIFKSNKSKKKQLEEDCDRSQSSRSSRDGKKGRRSSFRSLGGPSRAGRGFSPRWRDQEKHLGVAYSDDNASVTDDQSAAAALTSSLLKKAGASPGTQDGHDYHEVASQTSQADSLAVHAHDSHDEGYLSHSTFEGYKSEGSASKGEGRLTPSIKNTVEDIEMAEMASVASSGPAPTPFERFMHRRAVGQQQHKGVEFASHAHNFFFHKNAPSHLQTASPSGSIILNDMGPPPCHNTLYFAANAACASAGSHAGSVRSFDTGDAPSDVIAHVDTDDCDRSIIGSEACSLHSQVSQEDASHKEEKSESLAITPQNLLAHDIANFDAGTAVAVKNSLNNTSEERLSPGGSVGMKLPLKRFHQQVAKVGDQLDTGEPLDAEGDDPFTNVDEEAEFRRGRDYDDWSNSRSHSRSRSHSSSSSSSEMSRSRSRSRSRSESPEEHSSRERRMRWKDTLRRPYERSIREGSPQFERSPLEEEMEDGSVMIVGAVRDCSMELDRVSSKRTHSPSPEKSSMSYREGRRRKGGRSRS